MTLPYAGAYPLNDPAYLETHGYEQPKESFKLVVELIKERYGQGPLSLIDVGCASGAFLYYARQNLNLVRGVGTEVSDAHLEQAQRDVPGCKFILDSILTPQHPFGAEFDVCTCLGVVSIFDEIDIALANLLSLVKPGGMLCVFDLFNDYPIDMIMRYRIALDTGYTEWRAAFNVRSCVTYERIIVNPDRNAEVKWVNFEMPFAILQQPDPLRAWTIRTEYKPHQLVVGTGQMLNFKILQVVKK
jgi:SAM-dependent methyltransferase